MPPKADNTERFLAEKMRLKLAWAKNILGQKQLDANFLWADFYRKGLLEYTN